MHRRLPSCGGRAGVHRASLCLLALAALALAACSGDAPPSVGGETGAVAITLTDAPSDEFAEVDLTLTAIELLGSEGPVVVWSGLESVNLLDLDAVSELFSVASEVPVGRYSRLRLTVSDIALIGHDGQVVHPDLPAHGRIEVDPGDDLEVEAALTLLVEVDVDVEKSIVVRAGRVLFRPVVLAHELHRGFHGRLMRLHGRIAEIDEAQDRLRVCRTHVALRPMVALAVGQPVAHRCVDVALSDESALFDRNGEPTDLASLEPGEAVTLVGRFRLERPVAQHELVFVAGVLLAGEPGSFTRIRGWVDSTVDASDRFDLEVGPGEPFVEGTTLAVQLQQGTLLFSWPGFPLEPEDVEPGLRARVVGVLQLSDVEPDRINAAWVRLQFVPPDREVLRGVIDEVSANGARLVLATDAGSECVDVGVAAEVIRITTGPEGSASERIPRGALVAGVEADVTALEVPGRCWLAQTVITFEENDSGAPE